MDKWHFEFHTAVTSTDSDAYYECRASSLFNIVQRATVGHAMALGVGQEEALNRYHGNWMALRIHIKLNRALVWGEQLRVVTSMRMPEEKRLNWDCDFYVDEEHVGESTTTWVLVDRVTKRTMPMNHIPEFPQAPVPGSKTYLPARIQFPDGMAEYDRRKLYYSDTDVNGHVNNARYVDLACDAAELHLRPKGVFLEEMDISYIGQCMAGEVLSLYRGKADGFIFIHGVGPDGSDRFDCRIKMSADPGM
jgi:acyl-CoA thioesterase FadM